MSSRDEEGGEVFQFLAYSWDVERALEFVPDEVETSVELGGIASMVNSALGVYVDEEYAASLTEEDLERPIILGTLPEQPDDDDRHRIDRAFPIDGWHRIWKALDLGRTSLPAYLLTPDEEAEVFTDSRPTDHGAEFAEWVRQEAKADEPMLVEQSLDRMLEDVADAAWTPWEVREILTDYRDVAEYLLRKADQYEKKVTR